MWVARAVRTFQDAPSELKGRQLPGQNAVRRYLTSDANARRLGLSAQQYERYRFAGPHGAYRGLLAGLDGFTAGNDGYRPGRHAESLASVLKDLPHVREPRRTRGKKPTPEDYWQQHWPGWRLKLDDLQVWLPSRWNTAPSLRADEKKTINPAMFERGEAAKRRKRVAELAARSPAASHRVLVAHVVAGLRSSLDQDERSLAALLPQFTAFADAGVDAMLAIWRPLKQSTRTQWSVTDLLAEGDCKTKLEELRERASGWKQPTSGNSVALFRPVGELAGKLRQSAYSGDTLRALLEHHIANGGGRRWFRLSGSRLSADTPTAGDNASPVHISTVESCPSGVATRGHWSNA